MTRWFLIVCQVPESTGSRRMYLNDTFN